MADPTRREFIRTATTGIAASAGVFAIASSAKAAPSERVRHAVIGMGSQGNRHARTFHGFDDCEVVAVCDVDPERRRHAANELSDFGSVAEVERFEDILDDASIDSVSIATPDHWHTPVALHALNAGKHVYVEKPCSHTLEEGRILAEAAARSGKCVQHGTQCRSSPGIREAIQLLREGAIGTVRCAKAINHQLRRPIGTAEPAAPPKGVDYDRWTGPAPVHPFTANRWHYNWHWFWDYGTGDMGNDGVHQIDVARWGLGDTMPTAVSAMGGQLFYQDDHETPDTQMVTFDFGESYLIYEMRLWTNYKLEGHDNGVVFYGDNGTLEVGRSGCELAVIGEEPKVVSGGKEFDPHLRNYLDALKAGDPALLNAPIAEGARSAALCHYGNIGTRVARTLTLKDGAIQDDAQAEALASKTYRAGYELPKVG